MSIIKNKRGKKIKTLLEDGRSLYHTQDLAALWGISNSNTLYTTIKRYVEAGYLNRVHKGFYSTTDIKKVDPYLLGVAAIHDYGYISTESILTQEGVIFQDVKYITMVSRKSKRFSIERHHFLTRKMKDDFLYNETGVVAERGIKKATKERAIADMLYFNPDYYFDTKEKISWKKVKEIQKAIGY